MVLLFHQQDIQAVKISCSCFIILFLSKAETFEGSCIFFQLLTSPGTHFTNQVKGKGYILFPEPEIFYLNSELVHKLPLAPSGSLVTLFTISFQGLKYF